MAIYIWKPAAILITKTSRYIVPVIIAAAGAVTGYIVSKLTGKKNKRIKPQNE